MSINPALYSSKTDAHNTPAWLVDKLHNFFDGIDLDPATDASNPTRAARFFTVKDDGLMQSWKARNLYLNCPYGRRIGAWAEKLVMQYALRNFGAAIALLPARTDTQWWQTLSKYTVCFVRGRLKFSDCAQSAPFPSALVYLGDDWLRFRDHFGDIGLIYIPAQSWRHGGKR
jgi:phage N-6-adenine-methyltransferase